MQSSSPREAIDARSEVDRLLHFPGAQVEHRNFPGAGAAHIGDFPARSIQSIAPEDAFADFRESTRRANRHDRSRREIAYVSGTGAGKIAVLDLRSWKMQQSIDLTPGVDGLAWATALH